MDFTNDIKSALITVLGICLLAGLFMLSLIWNDPTLGGPVSPVVSTSTQYTLLDAEQQRYLLQNGEYLQISRSTITLESKPEKVRGERPAKSFDMSVVPPNTRISVYKDTLGWGYRAQTEYTNRYEIYTHDSGGNKNYHIEDKEFVLATTTREKIYLR